MASKKGLNKFLTSLCVFSIVYAFLYLLLPDFLRFIFNLIIIVCVPICSFFKIRYFMITDRIDFLKELKNMAILYFAVTIGFACSFDLLKHNFSYDKVVDIKKAKEQLKVAEERVIETKKAAEERKQSINEMAQKFIENPEEFDDILEFTKDMKIRAINGRTAILPGPGLTKDEIEKDFNREIRKLEAIRNGFLEKYDAELNYSDALYDSSKALLEAKEGAVKRVTLMNFIYFSATTITTLGTGEIKPTSSLTKMLVVIEVFIGLFLIVVYINAAASRSQFAVTSREKRGGSHLK